MNSRLTAVKLLFLVALLIAPRMVHAQGTTFTYQGHILDGGAPANGTNYDMMFSLYNAVTNGNQLGNLQVTGVAVSNGLFTVPLNFGQTPFSGSNLWVEIAVQKSGSGFLILTPRQPLTSAPYAIMANTASNLAGPLPSNGLAGAYSTAVSFSNTGSTFSGAFTGNGNGLTNLNGAQLTGTVPAAALPMTVAMLNVAETFTGAVKFASPMTVTNALATSIVLTGSNNATAGGGVGTGVLGATAQSNGAGVYGRNLHPNGTGVVAIGNGLLGSSLTAGSGLAADGSQYGIFARSEGSGAAPAAIFTQLGGLNLVINYFDGTTTFKIMGNGVVSTLVNDGTNNTRIMFAPEAPEVFFEDYGSGKLANGRSHIVLDPIFTTNILVDASHPLRVFVQVEDDCKGVYVTNKSGDGFDVVELAGGTSSAAFSWHATGNRADEEMSAVSPAAEGTVNGKHISHYSNLRFPLKKDGKTTWRTVKPATEAK